MGAGRQRSSVCLHFQQRVLTRPCIIEMGEIAQVYEFKTSLGNLARPPSQNVCVCVGRGRE